MLQINLLYKISTGIIIQKHFISENNVISKIKISLKKEAKINIISNYLDFI